MPSASAASVPGSSARCTWHFSAVRLRYGSIAISLRAAALRLLHAAPQVQVGDDRIGAPDEDQPGILELLEVGADRRADRRGVAALPAVAQIVRSSSEAPSLWKKRRSIEQYCSSPIVPA